MRVQGLSVATDISDPDPAIHNAGIELLKDAMKVSHQCQKALKASLP